MNTLALVMVLASAASHATWNFLSLLDKQAVSGAHVSPLLYNYGVILVRVVLLSSYALCHWHKVRLEGVASPRSASWRIS